MLNGLHWPGDPRGLGNWGPHRCSPPGGLPKKYWHSEENVPPTSQTIPTEVLGVLVAEIDGVRDFEIGEGVIEAVFETEGVRDLDFGDGLGEEVNDTVFDGDGVTP